MAEVNQKLVQDIVRQVISQLEQNENGSGAASPGDNGVFDRIDDAISATLRAQKEWLKTSRETKTKVINALRQSMHENAEEFSRRAQAETGMGRVKDKIVKHRNAADATPGLEDLETRSWTGDKGLVVEEYAPYGVVAAITPSTHPIPVLLNSIIIMIAPGNGAVFNVHPAAKKVSAYAMDIFNRVIVASGGPPNLVSMVREPTMDSVDTLFKHPDLPIIAATGGPMLVKAAFAAGKKVVAAGPGNPPVFVDDTVCLKAASRHIIEGASFDNNILCIAEKEIFVLNSVFEDFMRAMEEQGAVRLNANQVASLTQKAFSKNQKGQVTVGRDYIGKNASVLAKAAGLNIGDDVRLLIGETAFDHLFVQEEQMMPFLPVVRVDSVEQGIEYSVRAEHGFQHTAMIHSNDINTITQFTKAIDTDIVVANGSSLAGNGGYGGEAYFSHTIASPTGEGICTPRNFARIRRLATFGALQQV